MVNTVETIMHTQPKASACAPSSEEVKFLFGRERSVPKEVVCGWEIIDQPGRFMLLPKGSLNVDQEYQRTNVANARVLAIANGWSWAACGCLIVGRRPDNSLWVVDGQHRLLAARKLASVQELPSLVFEMKSRSVEAIAFISANTVRGPVAKYHRYRAGLVAGDPAAIAIRDLVESSGYTVASGGKGDRCVACVEAIESAMRLDPHVAGIVWRLCVSIAAPQAIVRDLFTPLFYLERHLGRCREFGSLADERNSAILARLGAAGILQAVSRAAIFYGKGGAKVGANGVLQQLNKRRRHKIPDIPVGGGQTTDSGAPGDGGEE